MKDRTLEILTALIEDFVSTANPVASRKLLESSTFKISSATVRNEFAILEEVGFIYSPHTSAGKIPTEKGFRFFVNELMEENFAKKSDEKKLIKDLFEKHLEKYHFHKVRESILDALKLASTLSGNIAFAVLDNDESFLLGISNILRKPEFLKSPEEVAKVIEVLEGKEKFANFLQNLDLEENEIEIFIGKENILEEVSSCSMIVSKFQSKNITGYFGILGPVRMKYGFNKELIKNILKIIN